MKQLHILLCFLCFAFSFQAHSQTKQNPEVPSPIIFIYDASGSMWGQVEGKTKMEIASGILSTSIEELPENQQIGLVAYGHRNKSDCEDVEFLVDVDGGSKASVNQALAAIKPLGKTPLAYSATQVIDKLRISGKKATIILVTDGIESCGGNICDVVAAAKKEGIDFKLHIVGFGLKDSETEQLICAAEAGQGNYYHADDASGLSDAINEVVTETVDKPEGNFGVYAVKNNQPIDAYIKAYKTGTKEEMGALRTYGGTRFMYLPAGRYDLVASPLSSDVKPVTIENVESFEDQITEQVISFDGGKIAATPTNNGEGWDTMVKIIDSSGKVAAQGRTYGRTKELEVNPGIYKVTFQALAMKGLETYHETEAVTIKAGEITPADHDFETGTVNIYAKVDDEQIDSIVNVVEINSEKNVDGGRTYNRGRSFLLNPGIYKVTVQPLGVHKDKKGQTVTIELKQGEAIDKTFSF